MTDEQRAKIEEIAANLGTEPEPEQGGPKNKKKAKPKQPTKEDVRAAVAGVVLVEMKFWPEPVVSLIGEEHPNKESFLKGVAYVIGGYMHFARKSLEELVKRRKKKAENKTCRLLSPVASELQSRRSAFLKSVDRIVSDLEQRRKKELEEAEKAINKLFDKLILEVKSQKLPDRVLELVKQEAKIKGAYEGACSTIDAEAAKIREQIEEIEEAKESWDSKKRKARRLANEQSKEAAQEAKEAVE
jgi:hypothetical protein